eukprot:GHVT01047648.1.p1 GENE.GHVT01047648.1~~GHVT01047648.1.p1  ORF type:complete len:651 (+),score=26.86 GHVT01047648.1:1423-3375(+)
MEDDALSCGAPNAPFLRGNVEDYHNRRLMLRTSPPLYHDIEPTIPPNPPENRHESPFSDVGHTPNDSRVFYDQQESRRGMARDEDFCENTPDTTAGMLSVPTFRTIHLVADVEANAAAAASVLPGSVSSETSCRETFHPENRFISPFESFSVLSQDITFKGSSARQGGLSPRLAHSSLAGDSSCSPIATCGRISLDKHDPNCCGNNPGKCQNGISCPPKLASSFVSASTAFVTPLGPAFYRGQDVRRVSVTPPQEGWGGAPCSGDLSPGGRSGSLLNETQLMLPSLAHSLSPNDILLSPRSSTRPVSVIRNLQSQHESPSSTSSRRAALLGLICPTSHTFSPAQQHCDLQLEGAGVSGQGFETDGMSLGLHNFCDHRSGAACGISHTVSPAMVTETSPAAQTNDASFAVHFPTSGLWQQSSIPMAASDVTLLCRNSDPLTWPMKVPPGDSSNLASGKAASSQSSASTVPVKGLPVNPHCSRRHITEMDQKFDVTNTIRQWPSVITPTARNPASQCVNLGAIAAAAELLNGLLVLFHDDTHLQRHIIPKLELLQASLQTSSTNTGAGDIASLPTSNGTMFSVESRPTCLPVDSDVGYRSTFHSQPEHLLNNDLSSRLRYDGISEGLPFDFVGTTISNGSSEPRAQSTSESS